MKFHTLANEVAEALVHGDIPASPHVPVITCFVIPRRNGTALEEVCRRTFGKWAGFCEEWSEEDFGTMTYDTYYIDDGGNFAVAKYHPSRIVLKMLPTLEVLQREDMWRRGLGAMLDSSYRPRGLSLNPV